MLVVLPAPLGPMIAEDLPALDLKRDIVDRLRGSEEAVQPAKLDHGVGRLGNHQLVFPPQYMQAGFFARLGHAGRHDGRGAEHGDIGARLVRVAGGIQGEGDVRFE